NYINAINTLPKSLINLQTLLILIFFFFNDTATTEIYTLSLHDALPICWLRNPAKRPFRRGSAPRGAGTGTKIFYENAFCAGTIALRGRLGHGTKDRGRGVRGIPARLNRGSLSNAVLSGGDALWAQSWVNACRPSPSLLPQREPLPSFDRRSSVPAASPSVRRRCSLLSPNPGRGDTHASY